MRANQKLTERQARLVRHGRRLRYALENSVRQSEARLIGRDAFVLRLAARQAPSVFGLVAVRVDRGSHVETLLTAPGVFFNDDDFLNQLIGLRDEAAKWRRVVLVEPRDIAALLAPATDTVAVSPPGV